MTDKREPRCGFYVGEGVCKLPGCKWPAEPCEKYWPAPAVAGVRAEFIRVDLSKPEDAPRSKPHAAFDEYGEWKDRP